MAAEGASASPRGTLRERVLKCNIEPRRAREPCFLLRRGSWRRRDRARADACSKQALKVRRHARTNGLAAMQTAQEIAQKNFDAQDKVWTGPRFILLGIVVLAIALSTIYGMSTTTGCSLQIVP